MPLTKVTKKERTLHWKSWINKEIQYLLCKKDKLFRKYCTCKDVLEVSACIAPDEFKRLRNIITYEIRKSK